MIPVRQLQLPRIAVQVGRRGHWVYRKWRRPEGGKKSEIQGCLNKNEGEIKSESESKNKDENKSESEVESDSEGQSKSE